MPWKETDTMKERGKFVLSLESGLFGMKELCDRFGVSRSTGYKWWNRYCGEGLAGLEDLSRAPSRCPHKTPPEIEKAVVDLRKSNPDWGPVTLRTRLMRTCPEKKWPASSTIGDILKGQGLVAEKKRPRRSRHPGRPYVEMLEPNDVWSADFKGEFRMGNRRYVYPLTVADGHARFLLGCQGLYSVAHDDARPVFKSIFREFGLPLQMLTDNGVPFVGPNALAGLSSLAVWWIQLGIHPIRIEPGRPDQNGRHERMHRTLKRATARPPATNLSAQQRKFNRFRRRYNEERPHRALGGDTPQDHYVPSPRPYPERIPPIEYPGHFEKRKVATNGCIKWHDRPIIVSRTLIGEYVGFEEVGDGIWSVFYGPVLLARFDERERRLQP